MAAVAPLLIVALGTGSIAFGAGLPTGSSESSAVSQAITHQLLQAQGAMVVSQGGQGGTAEPRAPEGAQLDPALTSAYSDTWRVPDRPLITRIYPTPVNYLGGDKLWHPIANRLIPGALGGYRNEANRFSLEVPSGLSKGVSLSAVGGSVSFALEGAREAFPSISGSRATYSEALASTDLEYVSSSNGVQETATLKDSSAPEALRFDFSSSSGLQAQRRADGTIVLVDGQGKQWFRIPAPLAFLPGAGADSGRGLSDTLISSGGDGC